MVVVFVGLHLRWLALFQMQSLSCHLHRRSEAFFRKCLCFHEASSHKPSADCAYCCDCMHSHRLLLVHLLKKLDSLSSHATQAMDFDDFCELMPSEVPDSDIKGNQQTVRKAVAIKTKKTQKKTKKDTAKVAKQNIKKHHANNDVAELKLPTIVLGTFFSGIETPSIAMKQCGLKARLAFCAEWESDLNKLIRETWHPEQSHLDINSVDFKKLPHADVLVCGPPCQSFAAGGLQGGLDDPRGTLIFKPCEYVECRKSAGLSLPRAIVLENSKLVLGVYRNVDLEIKVRLEKCGYRVEAEVMNTNEHGINQVRSRMYLVGWLQWEERKMKFPRKLDVTIPWSKILIRKGKKVVSKPCSSKTNKQNIQKVAQ